MPTILRNNVNSIEVDRSANFKYTITKGGFDVFYNDTGIDGALVYIILRSAALTDISIALDWRDISDPIFSSAEALRDTLLEWSLQAVVIEDGTSIIGRARLVDALGVEITDSARHAVISMDKEDKDIYDGNAFYLFENYTIPSLATMYIELITGSKEITIQRSINNTSTNNIRYSIFEAPTITDGTVELIPFNANRVTPNATTTKWYKDPSGISGGTPLGMSYLAGTNQIRSTDLSSHKTVYKPNTKYVGKIENLNAAEATIYFSYFWTEK